MTGSRPLARGGKPFRRSTFGRKWRKARAKVGLPESFRYDLRHTGHTFSTQSGATLRDTMVRAGQSSERAALIHQHSNLERQREVVDAGAGPVAADRMGACGQLSFVRAQPPQGFADNGLHGPAPPGRPAGADGVEVAVTTAAFDRRDAGADEGEPEAQVRVIDAKTV